MKLRAVLVPVLAVVALLNACTSVTDSGAATGHSSQTRQDVSCESDDLGSDETTEFMVAAYVVDGELGAVCFGEEDLTLVIAWNDLAAITPPDQLNDLALFGGFVAAGEEIDADEETLAFVNGLDDDGESFQMSVNLDSYDADRAEARLTMAHEFSHVFTQLPSQVDSSIQAVESCATYLSTSGCFVPASLIAAWVEQFWGGGLLDGLDIEAEATGAAGEERCAANPGFFGPYAASDPEEDFAESFSAYVYDLEAQTTQQQAKLDWLADQPGLVEFRARAETEGLTPLVNNFEVCG